MLFRPDAVDALLCLAEATVRPLYRVARRPQQFVVQEHQRLLRGRTPQLVPALAQLLEPPHAGAQFPELYQGRLRPAATVEQPVYLLHDLPKRSQLGQSARQFPQRPLPGWAEAVADEQVAVLEQVRHPLLLPGNLPRLALLFFAGSAAPLAGDLRRQLLAEFRQRVQHRPGDLLEDSALTELVGSAWPRLLEDCWVKQRAIRGDAAHLQAAFIQLSLELGQESADVCVSRVVVEDLEGQAVVPAAIHDREDAEGPIVGLVDGQVTAEVSQGFIGVGVRQGGPTLFPPRPQPSSGWWHRGRRHGGHARGAKWPLGRANHLRRQGVRPVVGRAGCTDNRAKPGRNDRQRSNSHSGGSDGG